MKCESCGIWDVDPEKQKEAIQQAIGAVESIGLRVVEDSFTEDIKGLCPDCTRPQIHYGVLRDVVSLAIEDDKMNEDRKERLNELLTKLTNLLVGDGKLAMFHRIDEIIVKESDKVWPQLDYKARHFAHRLGLKVQRLGQQPQHVDDNEKQLIQYLSERQYSTREIAFILDRSIETVHRHVRAI